MHDDQAIASKDQVVDRLQRGVYGCIGEDDLPDETASRIEHLNTVTRGCEDVPRAVHLETIWNANIQGTEHTGILSKDASAPPHKVLCVDGMGIDELIIWCVVQGQ